MDDMTPFEGRFEERLRAFASTGVQSVDSAAVARAAAVGHPKTAATKPVQRRVWTSSVDLDPSPEPRLPRRPSWPFSWSVARCSWWPGVRARRRAQVPAPAFRARGPAAPPTDPAPSAEPTSSAATRSTGVWIATGTMGTPRFGHTSGTAPRWPGARCGRLSQWRGTRPYLRRVV